MKKVISICGSLGLYNYIYDSKNLIRPVITIKKCLKLVKMSKKV